MQIEIIDAPNDVIKEALKKRVSGLEIEKVRLEQIIQEASDYINSLKPEK